ncbi:MAG TPA: hemolysin family protein [Opitutaceae bacterium]|nr:hemolysin family protein [Opitutaceae bacterium]HOR24729.1 hemolysin family protein [Opitutaceae bacterium]HPK49065.1 hemolysin family protein [Opitutaceae bacterium]
MQIFQTLLELLVIVALVAANGFFVAAEFALVKIRASQLQPMLKTGGWRVKFALRATQHLDAALSATQLGITLASLGLGWVGEPLIAHRLAPLLKYFGITEPTAVSSVSFAVAFGLITFLHIVFGELAPKSAAIQRPKGISLMVAAPLMFFYYAFYPFIWLLNGTANTFLRWAGIQPAGEGEHSFSAEELEYVFSHARHAHPGDALINRLMVRSLRLRTLTAQQIMRPRDQVDVLWLDRTPAENLRIAQTSGVSRFPVCAGSLDDVHGILLIREWLWQIQLLGTEAPIEPIIRPALTFTLRTPFHTMSELFRSSRNHLAIVLDDAGNMAGIVSFEDVLEEIVGDIRDEFDIERGPIFEHADNAIVVAGSFTMHELRAETGWALDWQPRENVATWAERLRGRPFKRGDSCISGEFKISAVDVSSERLRRVRIERLAPTEHTV